MLPPPSIHCTSQLSRAERHIASPVCTCEDLVTAKKKTNNCLFFLYLTSNLSKAPIPNTSAHDSHNSAFWAFFFFLLALVPAWSKVRFSPQWGLNWMNRWLRTGSLLVYLVEEREGRERTTEISELPRFGWICPVWVWNSGPIHQ